jgi:phosphoserine phosphatase RsbU/P
LAGKVQNYIFTRKRPGAMAGLDWGVYFQSAPEVSGDFYDFHEDERGVTWIVADISSKGIGAALLVSMLKGICLSLHPQKLSPIGFVSRLNEMLLNEMPRGMFLTSIVATIGKDGMLTYCNASHNPGMILHGHGQVTALRPSGSPLGVMTCNDMSRKLEENCFRLTHGDKLLLYTDGLVDIANQNRDFYGETRMVDSFKRSAAQSVGEHLNAMVYDLKQFQGATDAGDDVTMVLGQVI